jgi:hypothetical protein
MMIYFIIKIIYYDDIFYNMQMQYIKFLIPNTLIHFFIDLLLFIFINISIFYPQTNPSPEHFYHINTENENRVQIVLE